MHKYIAASIRWIAGLFTGIKYIIAYGLWLNHMSHAVHFSKLPAMYDNLSGGNLPLRAFQGCSALSTAVGAELGIVWHIRKFNTRQHYSIKTASWNIGSPS